MCLFLCLKIVENILCKIFEKRLTNLLQMVK